MHVTVCIPTRDRGASVAQTLESLAASSYDDFDVIVVDQSADNETAKAVDVFVAADARFTYIRSDTSGASAARNEAIAHASGEILAFTDDDCMVSRHWIARLVTRFAAQPEVGQICGAVRATPHDAAKGYVLTCEMPRPVKVTSPWLKWLDTGIGANMAFRREVLRQVGPFDELLCPGAVLYSAQDRDITYRVLRAGHAVLDDPHVWVWHAGFRTWDEGRTRMRRVGLGIGAAWMKHLRLGDLAILPTLLFDALNCLQWRRLLTLRPHNGVATLFWYCRGLAVSFAYPLDRRWRVYLATPVHKPLATAPEAADG
jgi:glycosyltransferase involved in cell wall biosynthesis